MGNPIAYVVDTETTGVTNHIEHGHPQVIELAYIPIPQELSKLKSVVEVKELGDLDKRVRALSILGSVYRYRPSMNIHKKAREVHGIWMKDLLRCPRTEDLTLPCMTYMIGHNIQYDYRCLGKPDNIILICTLRLARKLDKLLGIGFTNHKQDTLLLHFYGEEIRYLISGHHEALYDCVKCILLLNKLLEFIPDINTLEELCQFQKLESIKELRQALKE